MADDLIQPLENEVNDSNQAQDITEEDNAQNNQDSTENEETTEVTDEVVDDNTKFEEIYSLFLSQIDDYEIASIDEEEEMSLYIEKYLLNCLPSIQDAINSLDDIDLENKSFGFKLTFIEKALVAKAMKLEWVREKKFSLDLMRKSIGDRDFKAVQGTDYLRRLSEMEQQLRYELRDEIIQHSYSKEDYWSVFR